MTRNDCRFAPLKRRAEEKKLHLLKILQTTEMNEITKKKFKTETT